MNFRKSAVAIATIFALMLFIAPILITSNSILPICLVNQASAQTNTCLAQDATISGQNVQLLELQITNNAQKAEILGLQATIDTLENGRQSVSTAPQVVTVPIIITSTPDPNMTEAVRIITATPNIVITLAPELSDKYAELQATVSSLATTCIPYVIQEGDTPFSIAEAYGISGFDILEVNTLTDEAAVQLQIGDLLIVPLKGCPLLNLNTENSQAEDATAEATQTDIAIATITLIPTAINAQIEITRVISAGDIAAEGVEIRNLGGVVNMTGWTLSDSEGNTFTFPEQRLFTNGIVTVYTRVGQNTPIALYWGQPEAVWGDEEDSIVLANADGEAQASIRLS